MQQKQTFGCKTLNMLLIIKRLYDHDILKSKVFAFLHSFQAEGSNNLKNDYVWYRERERYILPKVFQTCSTCVTIKCLIGFPIQKINLTPYNILCNLMYVPGKAGANCKVIG